MVVNYRLPMHISPLLLLILILPHMALAEGRATWPLGNGEELRCTVEKRDGAVQRSLHFLVPGQEPALVWSRQQTSEWHWSDAIRYIYAAGRHGSVFTVFFDNVPDYISGQILQIDMATGKAESVRVTRSRLSEDILGHEVKFTITGKGEVTTEGPSGKRTLVWQPDGRVFLAGEEIPSAVPPENGTAYRIAASAPPVEERGLSIKQMWLIALGVLLAIVLAVVLWRRKSAAR